jgi:hypothetical protein
MSRRILVGLSNIGAIVLFQAVVYGQAGEPQSSVSIERIRAALNQPPPRLRVPDPHREAPTFRVEVRQRPFVLHPVNEKPFDPTFGLPSVGELLMSGIEKIRSATVDYKRGRTERRARKEVDDALAAFCAVRECPAPTP